MSASDAGQFQFSSATYQAGEGSGSVSATVYRVGVTTGLATVRIAATDGTAHCGSDWTAGNLVTHDAVLSFVEGETSQGFEVTIVNNGVAEGPVTVNLTLSEPTGGATLGTPSSAVLTIVDNDPGVLLVQSDGSTWVEEGGRTDTYSLLLTTRPAASVIVSVYGDSQVSVSPTTITFTIADWSTPQTVTVWAVDDDVVEYKSSGNVTHDAESNDPIYDDVAVPQLRVEIRNDNDTGGLSLTETDGSTDVAEGGATDTYSLVLTAPPAEDVQVELTWGEDPQVALSPVSLTFTPANWNIPQVVTVSAVDDAETEGDHSALLDYVTNRDRPQRYSGLHASVTVHITDNEASSDSGLRGLSLSAGALTPAFAPDVESYTAQVPYSVSSIKVRPTASESRASIAVNGSPVASGQESAALTLNVGVNVIAVQVTAQDGTTVRTYTISVNRAAPPEEPEEEEPQKPSGPLPPETQLVATLNPAEGGAFQTAKGGLKLEIPAGAIEIVGEPGPVPQSVSAKARVEVQEVDRQDVKDILKTTTMPEGVRSLDRVFEFEAKVTVDGKVTPVTSFARPVTLTVELRPEDLKNVTDAEMVGLFKLNDDGTLTFVGGKVVGGKLVVEMTGFSRYVLMEVRISFSDLGGHWAKRDVEVMASKYVVKRSPQGTFEPDGMVTRAEFAAMLVRAMRLPVSGLSAPVFAFHDVKPDH